MRERKRGGERREREEGRERSRGERSEGYFICHGYHVYWIIIDSILYTLVTASFPSVNGSSVGRGCCLAKATSSTGRVYQKGTLGRVAYHYTVHGNALSMQYNLVLYAIISHLVTNGLEIIILLRITTQREPMGFVCWHAIRLHKGCTCTIEAFPVNGTCETKGFVYQCDVS